MWPASWKRRSISSARILTGLAADYGVTPEQCLRGTGIPVAHLEDNTREIDARQELRIVDNLLDACGGFRPGMGNALPDRFFWAQAPEEEGAEEEEEEADTTATTAP